MSKCSPELLERQATHCIFGIVGPQCILETATVPRRTASIILSVIFGLLALDALLQVLLAALGPSHDPLPLTVLEIGMGTAAALTAQGSWRRAGWASGAAIAYGAITATMLAALPSLLQLPVGSRRGIWAGGAAVMLFALVCAAYFRADARRQAGRTPSGPMKPDAAL